jgi:ubiquinone/menaquinone biosynthesis C-methylase UbiE
VGSAGHYFHQHVVLPKSLKLLDVKQNSVVLDLACGQGVLARKLPKGAYYQGIDISRGLIAFAKKQINASEHHFLVGDVTKPLSIQRKDFTHAVCLLAIQNLEKPALMVAQAAQHLHVGGRFLIVMNHPSFRIPRQSSWGIDEKTKTQYRRIDRYFSELKVPITAHPGNPNSEVTWSFHLPLSAYSKMLRENGFVIEVIEEWVSDKSSEGKAAKMENRSRAEFPLFLSILAKKLEPISSSSI